MLLTRTSLGSKMLAVSEDATAASLMGIRPERMQAAAWAIAAGATGIAGALIATFFYTSPTVGETRSTVPGFSVQDSSARIGWPGAPNVKRRQFSAPRSMPIMPHTV